MRSEVIDQCRQQVERDLVGVGSGLFPLRAPLQRQRRQLHLSLARVVPKSVDFRVVLFVVVELNL